MPRTISGWVERATCSVKDTGLASVAVAIPTGDLFFVDSTEPEWLFVLLVACSHLSFFCGF